MECEEYAKNLISRLKKILDWEVLGIEHIGSTAIPTIKAKPIIDIALGVKTLDSILQYNDGLNKNGIIFRGSDIEEQLLYIVKDEVNPNIVKSHTHVVVFNSKAWKNYIVFRDFLRNNKEIAKRYELLKTELAIKYKDDKKPYTSFKQKFMEEIL